MRITVKDRALLQKTTTKKMRKNSLDKLVGRATTSLTTDEIIKLTRER